MIVEPTPTSPRSPIRRALRLAGLGLPVVLFAIVSGAGLLGPKPEPPAPPPSTAPVPPTAIASAVPDASSAPLTVAIANGVSPPAAFGGLKAQDPATIVAARASGGPLGEVAVTGLLSVRAADAVCTGTPFGPLTGAPFGPLGPWCERTGILLEAPSPSAGSGAVSRPPHLHVTVPVGVRLPDAVQRVPEGGTGRGVPVLVLGRFDAAATPCGQAVPCDAGFIVDRVAWAAGAEIEVAPLVAEGLQAGRHPDPFTTALGPDDIPLAAVLALPAEVARLEPAAATAAASGQASEPVWFVRAVAPATVPNAVRVVRWLLLGGRDLHLIAASVPDAIVAAGGDGTFPGAVASLRVVQIPDVLRARQGGGGRTVFAIAGYLRAWADPRLCGNPVPGLPGDGCERTAILAELPWTNHGSELFSPMGPHLHAVIPPGVAVPDTAVGLALTDADPPPPVVVIGHFASRESACNNNDPACEETFTIERVVWASGQRLALGRQVAIPLVASATDAQTADPGATAGRAIGPLTTLLRVVLLEPRELANVDASAATAVMAARTRPRGPVWYVRGLDVPYYPLLDPPPGRTGPVIRWAVIDEASGAVLARGETQPPQAPGKAATG